MRSRLIRAGGIRSSSDTRVKDADDAAAAPPPAADPPAEPPGPGPGIGTVEWPSAEDLSLSEVGATPLSAVARASGAPSGIATTDMTAALTAAFPVVLISSGATKAVSS